ncbi:MAG: hypothetical protein VKQ33_12650 [Candidatus Sericytochromatia bacterium]|nr:hypothetical protein [Candidatus Sericytochromatia bacterium]
MPHASEHPATVDHAIVTGITPLVPDPPADASGGVTPETPPAEARPVRSPGATPTAMMARMAEALQAHAALTERYARAGYQLGRLEAENRQLVAEREGLAAKLTELEVRLSETRLNEQVLEAERDRALQRVEELTVRLAEAGLRPVGRWQALKAFLSRHW